MTDELIKKAKKALECMKQRCFNPNNVSYKRYGGRGIKVCERWRASFSNFLADVGLPPNMQVSIDRINNDGDYEPGNCRWATRREQFENQTNNGISAVNARKTHCIRGHELTPENVRPDKRWAGRGRCRICQRYSSKKHYEKTKKRPASPQAETENRNG